ncbi:peptide chain release factor N(5)-glutamine methyltransferase [Flavobacteriaceae bacterium AH-315-B10]|nr:peptide chain release factor N(5)-glutamine methyltransferase [Flavobacteriaceae bacterium AH-315-B10]
MTLKFLKSFFVNSLLDCYPETEINSFFFILTENILGLQRINVVLDYDEIISEVDINKFKEAIKRLNNHEPIQYIIGKTEFYSLLFKVNEAVLIPRPETEELVDWIISKFKIQNSELKILDIGTGSGCIAISLAKNLPSAKVFALDVSKEALNIAKDNARQNDVEVEFIEADILEFEDRRQKKEAISRNQEFEKGTRDIFFPFGKDVVKRQKGNIKFDIIVSNPPYVRASEKVQMQLNVLAYEPDLALFVEDEDSLLFYRNITQFASQFLNTKGHLFFEINEYLGKDMVKLLNDEGFIDVELKQDIFGKDRMIKGVKL